VAAGRVGAGVGSAVGPGVGVRVGLNVGDAVTKIVGPGVASDGAGVDTYVGLIVGSWVVLVWQHTPGTLQSLHPQLWTTLSQVMPKLNQNLQDL
jgi:hypothetical protein